MRASGARERHVRDGIEAQRAQVATAHYKRSCCRTRPRCPSSRVARAANCEADRGNCRLVRKQADVDDVVMHDTEMSSKPRVGMAMKPGFARPAIVIVMLAALGTVASAQTARSSPEKPTKDDEVRAVVAAYTFRDYPRGTCFQLYVDPYVTMAGPELESLFRKRLGRRHDQAKACAGNKSELFYIADPRWSADGRVATVSAGGIATGTQGRPSYEVKRNFWGRWRAVLFALAE
jgi:hypothetical protein